MQVAPNSLPAPSQVLHAPGRWAILLYVGPCAVKSASGELILPFAFLFDMFYEMINLLYQMLPGKIHYFTNEISF